MGFSNKQRWGESMAFIIDEDVQRIISIVENNGEEAYMVGGCIRDMLMDKKPKDWDLTTSALPNKILDLFKKTEFKGIDLSKKHGTIVLVKDNKQYEITTFRKEDEYTDYRHPDQVTFVKKLSKDLQRRDFTMNALAYSESKGLVDLFKGQEAIKNKIIKCVGKPKKRFKEDALRILRGIRFSAQLDFHIEKKTLKAMVEDHQLIKMVSMERLQSEFNKIILSNHPSKGLSLLKKIGALEIIIPELKCMYNFEQHNPNHHLDVFEHSLGVLENTPKDIYLRLAAIFHDIGKPETFKKDGEGIGHFYNHEKKSLEITEKVLKRMRYSNEIIEKTLKIIDEHMTVYNDDFSDKAVKRLIRRVESIGIDRLIAFQIADIKGTSNPEKYQHVLALKERVEKIKNRKDPLSIRDLAIDGNDLMALGIAEGVKIGNILDYLLQEVLENPKLNTQKSLRIIAEETIDKNLYNRD